MEKFDKAYLEMAAVWARNSYCKRRQVGALIVKDRMIISDGYNGTPSGFENVCEDENESPSPMCSTQRPMPSPRLHARATIRTEPPSTSPTPPASNAPNS